MNFGRKQLERSILSHINAMAASLLVSALWLGIGLLLFPKQTTARIVWTIAGWTLFGLAISLYERRVFHKLRHRYLFAGRLEKQNAKLRRVQEIATAMSQSLPMSSLFDMIISSAHELTGAFFVSLSLINWKQKTISSVASTATDNALIRRGLKMLNFDLNKPAPLGTAEDRFRKGLTTTSDKITDFSGALFQPEVGLRVQKLFGIKRIVEVPLVAEGSTYGTLMYALRETEADLDLMRLFSNLCAQALKKAERVEALSQQEEYLKNVVNDFADGVIRMDPSGIIQEWNKGATRLFGYEYEEALARNFYDLIDFDSRLTDRLQRMDRVSYYESFEAIVLRKNQKRSYAGVTITAVFDSQDHITGFTAIVRDIDQERRLRQEIATKGLELGKLNSELIRSNLELKRLSELKTNFLSIASHELRTPLTSIQGYTEIIIDNMRDKVDPAIYKMIQTIAKSTNRLNQVVKDILDVTRIEQNRLKLTLEKVDLRKTIQECIEEIETFALQRHITIQVDLPTDLVAIFADRSRIMQVFINILHNALKFSPDGRRISIGAVPENSHVHLVFADQGIGIDKNDTERIFDSFYERSDIRQYSSSSPKFMSKGIGLGLAICRGIVNLHGGRVWAESEGLDKDALPGSRFHVLLPINPQPSNFIAHAPLAGEEKDAAGDRNAEHGLLLIGDDESVTEQARAVLGKVFSIDLAKDSGEGLRKAFRTAPALILLDLNVKGLTGLEVCRILKSQAATARIPVALISPEIHKEVIEQGYQAGAEEFIFRPIDGKELTDKVFQLLMTKKSLRKSGF